MFTKNKIQMAGRSSNCRVVQTLDFNHVVGERELSCMVAAASGGSVVVGSYDRWGELVDQVN